MVITLKKGLQKLESLMIVNRDGLYVMIITVRDHD
jgi:hypothetical protein